MRNMMKTCPILVKLSRGTVNNPVTVVNEVAVNKMSIKLIDVVRHIGNERTIVPKIIVDNNEIDTA